MDTNQQLDYIAMENGRSTALIELLKAKFGAQLLSAAVELGDAVVEIKRPEMLAFFQLLRLDSDLAFNMCISVTATDYVDSRPERFEMVYHMLSLTNLYRLRIKIAIPEEAAEVDSIMSFWPGANFMEREVWDMYGIRFAGHDDLRRILMYEEFVGHPLRKDYPVQGKQPRVALRAPEVRNTAVDMQRGDLVRIGGRIKT